MSKDYVRETAVRWFKQQPEEFFSNGTSRLVHQRITCLNAWGDSNCCNIFTSVHPQKRFSCTHLIFRTTRAAPKVACMPLYERCMQALVHRWRKCIANGGDYVEKYCFVAKNLLYQIVLLCPLYLL